MSPASIKASSLFSEAKMVDSTRVKFDVPIGTWGQTQVEVEYPWHRDLDSIILPLLETAHEQQAERQRKHRDSQPDRKSSSKKTRSIAKPERAESTSISRIDQQAIPMRPNEDIKLFLKGFESARDLTTKRGETFQTVLETYAQQTEKDVERLELFYKGKHASRGMTPDTDLKTAQSCKSTSSSDSSSTSTQSRENRRSHKISTETQDNGPERGSILVANGISIPHITTDFDERPYTAPELPEKSALRTSLDKSPPLSPHVRTQSWASVQTSTSDKALKLLGIDTNELAHQLAHVDSTELIPLQHVSSGYVTQLDLHPGPSRLARQHARRASAMSIMASTGHVPSVTCTEKPSPLQSQQDEQQYIDNDDVSSLHDSLSPVGHRLTTSFDEGDRRISLASSEKARKLLGVDRPDSAPGPTGRQGATYGDYERKTRSYTAGISPAAYPTEVASYAHPYPHSCRRNPPPGGSNAIDYRPRAALVGIPYDQTTARNTPDMAPTIPHPFEGKRISLIVTPFAEPEERHSDEAKVTTTCSGPVVEAAGEEMEPEHAIQFKLKGGKVGRTRACPRMRGVIEHLHSKEWSRRSWSS